MRAVSKLFTVRDCRESYFASIITIFRHTRIRENKSAELICEHNERYFYTLQKKGFIFKPILLANSMMKQ